MYRRLQCIALHTVRHSDRHDILTAYSREDGRVSLLVSAGTGREARRRRALLMPMSRFSCLADIRPGREIYAMRDVRHDGVPVATDPVRSMSALFAADILNSLLTEPMGDPLLYDYLAHALDILADAAGRRLANWHLTFLTGLTRFLGIEPDHASYRPGYIFDMTGGTFSATPPLRGPWLDRDEARAAERLLRITFANMGAYRYTRADRAAILDHLLSYYTLHHTRLTSLRSPDILREL